MSEASLLRAVDTVQIIYLGWQGAPGAHLQSEGVQGIRDRLLPQLPGVWLDRGELDKILERSAAELAPPPPPPQPASAPRGAWRDPYYGHSSRYEHEYRYRKRK